MSPKSHCQAPPQGGPEYKDKSRAYQALLADSNPLNYSQTVTLLILKINSSHLADKETKTERESQPFTLVPGPQTSSCWFAGMIEG